MSNGSIAKGGEDVPSPSQGQVGKPRRCCSPGSKLSPRILCFCSVLSLIGTCWAHSLPSPFSTYSSRNCSHRHISYQSLTPRFEYTPVATRCSHRICIFCILFLNWTERKRRRKWGEHFPFEKIQDPLAVRNSLGLALCGGVESEDSGISGIKCLW